MTGSNLIWLVLLSPVVGFLMMSLGGASIERAAGRKIAAMLAVLPIFVAFGAGAFLTWQLSQVAPDQRASVAYAFDWISLEGFRLPFELRVDPLSMLMVLIITGVGSLIHVYATAYMAGDRDFTRFFTYMNLFVASMLMLVLGNNL